jgi:hypothetical protein
MNSVSYDHRTVESSAWRKLRLATRALIRVRELAEDPKFKKAVLDELRKMGDQIDISPQSLFRNLESYSDRISHATFYCHAGR